MEIIPEFRSDDNEYLLRIQKFEHLKSARRIYYRNDGIVHKHITEAVISVIFKACMDRISVYLHKSMIKLECKSNKFTGNNRIYFSAF